MCSSPQIVAYERESLLGVARMVDFVELRKSEFWRKKFRKAVETRDADKNGYISRSDFQLVLERYQKLSETTAEKCEALSNFLLTFCDNVGLADASVQLTYEEFEHRWQDLMANGKMKIMYQHMFDILDVNGDGFISVKEWKAHILALGMSYEHGQQAFEAMDTNGDGKISMDEFVEYHFEYFYTVENKLNSAILYGPP